MNNEPYEPGQRFAIESVTRPFGVENPILHYHNSYELYFLEEGQHYMLTHDKFIQVGSQDVVLFLPNILHRSHNTKNHTRTCIDFTDKFLREYFTEKSIKPLLKCFNQDVISLDKKNYFKIKKLLERMKSDYELSNYDRIFIYLADVLNILNEHMNDIRTQPTLHSDEKLSQILSYISENYNNIDGLDQIASEFHITKNYLCRLFKKMTDSTITQYITNIKLSHACELLTSTKKSVTEISTECGFSSAMYFCRTFKNVLRVTPSEFRISTN